MTLGWSLMLSKGLASLDPKRGGLREGLTHPMLDPTLVGPAGSSSTGNHGIPSTASLASYTWKWHTFTENISSGETVEYLN